MKFAPTLERVAHAPSYARSLAIVSAAVRATGELYAKQTVSELRYAAGSVRAVYFETASSDERLRELCSRLSDNADELYRTLDSMLQDSRRYLDLLAASTRRNGSGGYSWTKVGDISLTFRRDHAGRPTLARDYRNVYRRAWYLAKDEIIVGGVGKFFIDMENFRSWPGAYQAASAEESIGVSGSHVPFNRLFGKLRPPLMPDAAPPVNWPTNAKLAAPSGTTFGRSPFALGMN